MQKRQTPYYITQQQLDQKLQLIGALWECSFQKRLFTTTVVLARLTATVHFILTL